MRRALAVAAALSLLAPAAGSARPVILAAGDSQMQPIYQQLVRTLAWQHRARVVYDAHPSTGVANPYLFSWVRHARAMAATVHPRATAVFLGANDGLSPLGGAPCCTRRWVARYADRVRRMMRSYRRHGRGHVYWFTVAARSRHFRRVARGADAAIIAAARHFRGGVTVLDLRPVITPALQAPDGVHLSPAGYRVATRMLLRAMRRDDVL